MVTINVISNKLCPLCGGSQFKVLGKPRISEKLVKFDEVQKINSVGCEKYWFYFIDPKLDMTDNWLSYL